MKKFYAIVLAIGFLTMGAIEAKSTEPKNEPAPPKFVTLLKDGTVEAGTTVQFSFRIRGTPVPEIKVYFNETEIDFENQTRYRLYNEFGYITFIINDAQPEDSGVYSFKITNYLGTETMKVSLKVTEKENDNYYF
ncbi:immunoglobulin domain-containing protein [Alistipes sp.]|uniref:immunoglobulin domain-containing protein n=1 Tax=Alistipes sp. TaxID=1872444 RepID=UPI003AF02CD9